MCFTVCLRDMLKYTASVREWMSADPQNIIAIHCKGGKGEAKDLHLFQCDVLNNLSWIWVFCCWQSAACPLIWSWLCSLWQDAQVLWCAPGLSIVTSLRMHKYVFFTLKLVQTRVNEGAAANLHLDSFLFVHQDSLEYFGERRTDKSRSSKFQGVETPSQVRISHWSQKL